MKKREKLKPEQIKELQDILENKESTAREVRVAQSILMIDQGQNHQFITSLTRISKSQIFDLRRKYLDHGVSAIRDKRKGKPKQLLTRRQRDQIAQVIREESPRKYGYNNDYWTTGILGDLIKRTFNVQYKSKKPYYLLFKQAKFSYHLPGSVYRNRNEEIVEKWKNETVPILKESFQDPETVVLCEDEMILTTVTTFQKIWLPTNKYPKIEVANKRERRSIYGFLNLKNGYEHAFKTEKQNMYETCKVLKKIRKFYPNKKILLLWDGAGWHRGSAVTEFIENDGRIKAYHFPPYAPELNPQEHVWKKGREAITHNVFIEKIDKTTDAFVEFLNDTTFNYRLFEYGPVS